MVNGRNVIAVAIQGPDSYVKEIVYIDEETGLISKHVMKVPLFWLTDRTEIKNWCSNR